MTIGVIYDEESLEYESVYLYSNGIKIFRSNDGFIKDWYDAMNYFILEHFGETLTYSSTVDDFVSDTKTIYDSANLKFRPDGKVYLSYKIEPESEWFEFFVSKNKKPTWKELKNMLDNI